MSIPVANLDKLKEQTSGAVETVALKILRHIWA